MEQLLQSARLLTGKDWQRTDDFHISVSRTVVLGHHWIEPLTDSLRERLNSERSFQVVFDKVTLYCNEENTRHVLLEMNLFFFALKN